MENHIYVIGSIYLEIDECDLFSEFAQNFCVFVKIITFNLPVNLKFNLKLESFFKSQNHIFRNVHINAVLQRMCQIENNNFKKTKM